MKLQPFCCCSSLSTLDTGSGREIPAICNGTGVWHGIFTQNPSTGDGQIPGCRFIMSVDHPAVCVIQWIERHSQLQCDENHPISGIYRETVHGTCILHVNSVESSKWFKTHVVQTSLHAQNHWDRDPPSASGLTWWSSLSRWKNVLHWHTCCSVERDRG